MEGRLNGVKAQWHEDSSVCVVLCSQGYPGSYEKGKEIRGLDHLNQWKRGFVFHSGTTKKDGRWLTSGGRVLGVTALGGSIEEAVKEVYHAAGQIGWEGVHYRRDIASRALQHPLAKGESGK